MLLSAAEALASKPQNESQSNEQVDEDANDDDDDTDIGTSYMFVNGQVFYSIFCLRLLSSFHQ